MLEVGSNIYLEARDGETILTSGIWVRLLNSYLYFVRTLNKLLFHTID